MKLSPLYRAKQHICACTVYARYWESSLRLVFHSLHKVKWWSFVGMKTIGIVCMAAVKLRNYENCHFQTIPCGTGELAYQNSSNEVCTAVLREIGIEY